MLLWCSHAQSCPTLFYPMDCKPIRLHCPRDSSGKNTEVGCHFLLQDLPNPGNKPMSPGSSALADRFFTTNTTCYICQIFTIKIIFSYKSRAVLKS